MVQVKTNNFSQRHKIRMIAEHVHKTCHVKVSLRTGYLQDVPFPAGSQDERSF